jgi:hypothetical protein
MAGRDFVRAGALSYVPSYHLETLKGLVAAHPGAETGHVQIIGRGGMQWHVSGAKRSIFRNKAESFRFIAAKILRFCRDGAEIPVQGGTRQNSICLSNFLKCNNAFQAF